jgi:hypothetical protein
MFGYCSIGFTDTYQIAGRYSALGTKKVTKGPIEGGQVLTPMIASVQSP